MISKLINSFNARPKLWIGVTFVVSMVGMTMTGFVFPDVFEKCWNEPFLLIFRERKCVNVEVYEFLFFQVTATAWIVAGVFYGIKRMLSTPENRKKALAFIVWVFTSLGGLSGVIQIIIALVVALLK